MACRAVLYGVVSLFLLGGAGCKATDPNFYDVQGRHVRDLEPKVMTLAVLPVELGDVVKSHAGQSGGAKPAASGIPFSLDAARMRSTIVETMRDLRAAATQVIEVDDPEASAAKKADLVIRPKFKSAKFERVGHTRVAQSTALWFCTWIGGFWVEDQKYSADVTMEWTVQSEKGQRKTQSTKSTNQIDLPLWDRTDAQSRGFYQSMIMPPYWTTANPELTSESLSTRALESATAQLVRELKTGSAR